MNTRAAPGGYLPRRIVQAETKAWAFDEIKTMFDSGQLVLAPESDSAAVDRFDSLLVVPGQLKVWRPS